MGHAVLNLIVDIIKYTQIKKKVTTEIISIVRHEGNRDVNRTPQFYNLDTIYKLVYSRVSFLKVSNRINKKRPTFTSETLFL